MALTNDAALSGLTVLDLSRVLAGPWATQILGDLGADILKVERPGTGDETRGWGPPYLKGSNGGDSDRAAYFAAANRNKRSVAVDMAHPDGAKLLRDLAAESDIVIENFKVGGLARYGLDYESLSAINPRLIYCSITGFGQSGPYAARAGYDFVIQAMSGLMSVTGEPDGQPQKVGVALTDVMTGLYAVIGILAAVSERERSGLGQHIDLSLLDVGVAAMANQAMNYLASGTAPTRMGNAHPNIVPYQVLPTRDGHVVIAVGNDSQFQRLCNALDRPDLAADPAFATNRDRVGSRERLIPLLTDALASDTTTSWVGRLEDVGVPCGPVNTMAGVFDDPHVKARGLALSLDDSAIGPVPGVASPLNLSRTPARAVTAPPALGADTMAVLRERLALDDTALSRLRDAGAIGGREASSTQSSKSGHEAGSSHSKETS